MENNNNKKKKKKKKKKKRLAPCKQPCVYSFVRAHTGTNTQGEKHRELRMVSLPILLTNAKWR